MHRRQRWMCSCEKGQTRARVRMALWFINDLNLNNPRTQRLRTSLNTLARTHAHTLQQQRERLTLERC